MKITIDNVKTTQERISITKREYTQLTQKADLYDEYKAAQRKRAKKITELLTPQQRSEKARKAALSRWNKNKGE